MRTLLFLILILGISNLTAQWHHTDPYGDEFDDIQMVDYLNGYAVGRDNGIGTCGSSTSAVFRTMDGGENWMRNALDQSYEITSVHFLDRITGWASCYYGKVIKTVDCGQTWTQYATGVPQQINDVYFTNSSVGFAVADEGHIRKSTNGGTSWSFNYDQGDASLRKVEFYNESYGFAVGTSGAILRTTDAGTTWEPYDTGNSAAFFDIEFLSEDEIFLSSYNAIYHSANAGDSWEVIDLTDIYAIRAIEFTSPTVGYIGGEQGQLWKTTDGGATWFDLEFPFDETIYAMDFLDVNTGYMTTNRAGIFYTEDAGETWYNQHTGIKLPTLFGSTDDLHDVHFLSADTGIVVGKGGNICMTYNAGLSWSRKLSPTTDFLSSVQWIDEERLVAAGDSGTFILSQDRGESWEIRPTPTSQYVQDLWFEMGGETGYLLGLYDTLLKTVDVGLTWEIQVPVEDDFYRDFDFLDADFGVIVGTDFVMRTLDGGATWTEQPYYEEESSLRCVDIVNDSLSYIGNNNVLISRNGGDYWDSISVFTSLFCDDISFLNDSLGYIVSGPGVSLTVDSARIWGGVSTPCLNNSWSLRTVDPVDMHHVYAAGDSPLRRLWSGEPSIRTHVIGDVFCIGEKLNISYRYDGIYNSGNTYIAQLSDGLGSFNSPVNIGSYYSPFIANHPSGVISCSIPAGLSSGSGYRIRVIGEDPGVIGDDNGFDIALTASLEPSISLGSITDACEEGPITFETTTEQAGSMQSYVWLVNGAIINHDAATWSSDSLQIGDEVQVTMSIESVCTSSTVNSNTVLVPSPNNPEITLSEDVTINEGESITLIASGLDTYTWEPPTYLSATDVASPLCSPDTTISYYVTGYDSEGCSVQDSVTVTVVPIVIDGLEEFSYGLEISPNPADDMLGIELEKYSLGELLIFDAIGHQVLSKQVEGSQFQIDISPFPAGLYFIQLRTQETHYQRQVVFK